MYRRIVHPEQGRRGQEGSAKGAALHMAELAPSPVLAQADTGEEDTVEQYLPGLGLLDRELSFIGHTLSQPGLPRLQM